MIHLAGIVVEDAEAKHLGEDVRALVVAVALARAELDQETALDLAHDGAVDLDLRPRHALDDRPHPKRIVRRSAATVSKYAWRSYGSFRM